MKTNIATNKSQSDRLLQCCVPAESADMTLRTESGEVNFSRHSLETELKFYEYDDPKRHIEICPAWSLSALLGFLPKTISDFWMTKWYDPTADGFVICDKETPYLLSGDFQLLHIGDGKYQVEYDWNGFQGRLPQSDNPIGACVLAIELLAANGYQLNGIEKGGDNV